MDVKQALKEQYHGGLAMFAQAVLLCPDDLWIAANVCGDLDRPFWRIALHCAYYTHLYMGQGVGAFASPEPTAIGRRKDFDRMWTPPFEVEPFELPAVTQTCSKGDVLEYIGWIDEATDKTVDGLDLDSDDNGFPWYKNMNKLSHELMNLRHLQGHVGQLSELLMARGIDIDWAGKAENYRRFLD